MKKSSLYTGLCYFFVGLVCLILALIFEWRAEGLLWGFAGAGIFPGLMMMWQYYHWTRPENREEYQRRLHIEKVEMKDEVPVGELIINKKGEFLDSVTLADKVKGVVEHIFNYVTGKLTDVTFEVGYIDC